MFTKLLGAEASSDDHAVLLHVSNRQKVSGLVLGQLGARFQASLALGVAAGQDGGAAVAQRWSESAEAHRGQSPAERRCAPAQLTRRMVVGVCIGLFVADPVVAGSTTGPTTSSAQGSHISDS